MEFEARNNNKNYGKDEGIYNWLIPLIIGLCYGMLRILNKEIKND